MVAKKKKKKTEAVAERMAPSAPLALRRRYQYGIAVLVLLTAIAVLYPGLVFQDKVFHSGDTDAARSFASPIVEAMEQDGYYPLWNPYLFSGMPSYESLSFNPHVYPVTVLTHFLANRLFFPNHTWLLLHTFLMGIGVFLLLMDRRVHFIIATTAGVLMMWMPNLVAVGAYGHGSQASASGYLPLVLLLWDRLWRGRNVVLNASLLVILLGFQLLRAHIQISYYTFALLALHVVFFGFLKVRDAINGKVDTLSIMRMRPGSDGKVEKKSALIDLGALCVVFTVIVVLALMVSAVLFLPVQDYAHYSVRGASESGGVDYDYATSWSLHPLETLTFVVPHAFGFGKLYYYGFMPFTDYPNYVGIVVMLFAIVGLFLARTRFAKFLVFVVVVTTFVAFGKHLPIVYNPLFNWLPYFNKFRVPVMILIVQQLAFVLLFGLGLSAVLKAQPEKARKTALMGTVAAAALLLIFAATYNYWTEAFPQAIASRIRNVRSVQEQIGFAGVAGGLLFKDLIKASVLLLVCGGVLLAYFQRKVGGTAALVLVAVVACWDLYAVDKHVLYPEKMFKVEQYRIIKNKSGRDRFLAKDPSIDFLQAQQGYFRVFPIHNSSSNRYMNFGISSIGGYHPAKLSLYENLLKNLGPTMQRGDYGLINMLNVRYLVAANPLPEIPVFKEVWQGADYEGRPQHIYENLGALPRVFFVDRYDVADEKQALAMLTTGTGFNIGERAILERSPEIEPQSKQGARATITRYQLNEIHMDVETPSAAILVLSEIYYPKWKVLINGKESDVIRANYCLRAVALPEGSHKLVFYYDAALLRKSLYISIFAFGVALILLIGSSFLALRGRMNWKHSS